MSEVVDWVTHHVNLAVADELVHVLRDEENPTVLREQEEKPLQGL